MQNLVTTKVKEFLFGGSCKTSITSVKTGTQFTYTIRVNRKEEVQAKERIYFISVAQSNNKFVYAGFIRVDFKNKQLTYTKGAKGCMLENAQEIKALVWVLKRALLDLPLDAVHISHCGTCAVCGKLLRNGEDMHTGIGPICRKRVS